MKHNLTLITAVVLSVFFHPCAGQEDPFVGNWIVCNRPEYTSVITKNENIYNFHANNGRLYLVLEKKGDDVLLAVAGDLKGTVRYDKVTNHLLLIEVINKEERRIELCRSSGNKKQENLQKSRLKNSQENDETTLWDSVFTSQASSRAYIEKAILYRKDANALRAAAEYDLSNNRKEDANKKLEEANRNYKKAIEYYSEAIKINVINHESYNNRANIYMDLNKFDSALIDYRQAITIKPDYYVALDNIGAMYARRGMYDSALYYFAESIETKNDYKPVYNNRAIVYLNTNRFREAIQDWQTYLIYDRDNPDVLNSIGECHRKLGQNQDALKYINMAIQIERNGFYFLNRSYTHKNLNNIDAARNDALAAKSAGIQLDSAYAASLGIQ